MATTGLQLDPDDEQRRRNLAITLGQQQPQLGNLRQPQPQMGPDVAAPTSLPDQSKVPDLAISQPKVQGPRGTLEADKAERSRELATGSGESQIYKKVTGSQFGQNHPLLGKILGGLGQGAATIGDIGLSTVAPQIAAQIPGTQFHHNLDLRNLNKQIGAEEGEQEKEAQTAAQQSEVPLHQAQTQEAQVRTQTIPEQVAASLAEHGYRIGEDGKLEEIPEGELSEVQRAQLEATRNPWMKEAGNQPLADRVPQLNQAMASRYQVMNPGKPLPPELTLPKEATKSDFDRLDKMMEAQERAAATKEQHEESNRFRQTALDLASQNRETKQDTSLKQASFKAFTPAMDSAERFNVMTKNYEDAIKNHDQQAMLSLLANHLGMTMGLQKGSRLTRDIIREAQESRPWLQGLEAKFDKNGYLTGVTLTLPQMQQMVSLGRERYSEDVTKARNESRYLGAQDDGPDRTPGKATINFYLSQANGDIAKAKQMAAEDGWTVK